MVRTYLDKLCGITVPFIGFYDIIQIRTKLLSYESLLLI